MLFGLIKIKQDAFEFLQNSRVFFKRDKAMQNIGQLALKLENTSLISDDDLRKSFLFYWTAVRVKIYLNVVNEFKLFDPKNIDLKDFTSKDAQSWYNNLENHLLTYVSYDINPHYDTQTGEGEGIVSYYKYFDSNLYNNYNLRDYSVIINAKCFADEFSEHDIKILDEFLSISKNTFTGAIKNTKIYFK